METLLSQILTENWLIACLFVWLLIWIYRLLKYFLQNYLNQIKEHNDWFLDSLKKIVKSTTNLADNVVKWNNEHSKEHKLLIDLWNENLEILKDLHKSIKDCKDWK